MDFNNLARFYGLRTTQANRLWLEFDDRKEDFTEFLYRKRNELTFDEFSFLITWASYCLSWH